MSFRVLRGVVTVQLLALIAAGLAIFRLVDSNKAQAEALEWKALTILACQGGIDARDKLLQEYRVPEPQPCIEATVRQALTACNQLNTDLIARHQVVEAECAAVVLAAVEKQSRAQDDLAYTERDLNAARKLYDGSQRLVEILDDKLYFCLHPIVLPDGTP